MSTSTNAEAVPVRRIPDILDVIAQLSSDEVPTPPILARALLDLLPEEAWSNADYRWLNPASKSGSILRETTRRLMNGLTKRIADPQQRLEHIQRNMVFGCSITELTGEMTRRSVYVSRDATSTEALTRFDEPAGNLPFLRADHKYPLSKAGKPNGPCEICKAPISLERGPGLENYAHAFIHGAYPTEEMKDMQFDVIVGNPPYQLGTEGFGATASSIYQLFVEKAVALDPKYVAMIIPSRWFGGGKGLDDFRNAMINDRRLKTIVDNPKMYDCFPGVKIRGGVNYFLWDREYSGDCEFSTRVDGKIVSTMTRDLRGGNGVLMRDNRAVAIVDKARTKKTVEDEVQVSKPFGLTMRSNYPGSVPDPFSGAVPLIYNSKVGYSRLDQIERNHQWIDRYKVLIPRASSGDTQQDAEGRIIDVVLGEPIALAPGSACTQSYMIAGMFDTAEETENFAHYLATKFVRFLVLQRKLTQDVTPDRFRFVPMLDMKKRWSDEDLYKKFKLTQAEIDYIEATIKPRSVNINVDSGIPASHLPGGSKYRSGAVDEDDEGDEGDDE